MNEIKKLFRAARYLEQKSQPWIKYLFLAVMVVLLTINIIMVCSTNNESTYNHIGSIVTQNINLLFCSSMCFLALGNITRSKSSLSGTSFIELSLMLPIKKTNILKYRYIFSLVSIVPALLVIIISFLCYIIKGISGFAGYIGLEIIIVSFFYIMLNFYLLDNIVQNNKNTINKVVSFIIIVMLFILPSSFILVTTFLQDSSIHYGLLGKNMAPFIKSLEIFAGPYGILFIVATLIVGYFISCVLPMRVFKKKGWNI